MPNSHKPGRQNVQQESPGEFLRFKSHPLVRLITRSVVPSKCHAVIVMRHESVIPDSYTVRVSPEVSQHLLRSGKGCLAIDDPVIASGFTKLEMGMLVAAAYVAVVQSQFKLAQQPGPKQTGKNRHRKEEARPCRHPTTTIQVDSVGCTQPPDMSWLSSFLNLDRTRCQADSACP